MVSKPKSNDKTQVRRFRKAARELGSDVSEERFQNALRTVAKPVAPISERLKQHKQQKRDRKQKADLDYYSAITEDSGSEE